MRLKLFLIVAVVGALLRGAAFFSGGYINSDGKRGLQRGN
jgi:membrane protein DedA with SNARE-associated domain